jgi:hypothetical protein
LSPWGFHAFELFEADRALAPRLHAVEHIGRQPRFVEHVRPMDAVDAVGDVDIARPHRISDAALTASLMLA